MMNFTIIDWIFSVLIIIVAITGLAKGFINNIFGKLAWILGIIFAVFFYDDVAASIMKGIGNPLLENILAFVLVFVVVFLVIKIIQMIFARIFEINILKSLDRTLGFFFGIVEGLAIVWLIILLLISQPFFPVDRLFENSFFYGFINSVVTKTKEVAVNV